jgi:uncharacterized protein YjiK
MMLLRNENHMLEIKNISLGKQIVCVMLFMAGMATCTVFASCKGQINTPEDTAGTTVSDSSKLYSLPYEIDRPDAYFSLPLELQEISGLSMEISERFVWCVQDEKGVVYKVDLADGSISEKIPFWKAGDYEGVQQVGKAFYVVKSTGTIYQIHNLGESDQQVEKYNTELEKANDVEGLTFDVKNNRLLLACKGSAHITSDTVSLEKAIYEFSLDSFKLNTTPAFLIHFEDVRGLVKTTPTLKNFEKLSEYFQPGETEFTFNPSGISIHPLTGEIYLLSATKKLMAVLSPEGEMLYIEKMKKKLHPQPEGICFASDGTLYISNEGKDGKAKLYKYSMKK